MWVFFALGAALLTSFNPILYKRMLSDSGPVAVVWGVIGLALPLLALTTFAFLPALPQVDALFVLGILGSATLNTLAHLASARSLQLADASLVTPLLTFSPVFTLLISAIFLGEMPEARGLIGIMLVLVGAYWLNRGPESGWLTPFKSVSAKPGVGLVLFAGLLWAVTPIFEKLAIQHTFPESPRFAALAVNGLLVILLTPFTLWRGRSSLDSLARHRREWLLAALIAGIAPTLGYTAFSLGLVGYVTTLFRLSAAFTVVWSTWLLGETGLRRRLPASIVMVIGAILIAV
ncbi:MAG TPA: DMT family transporter [Anaerolineales bacterium]|nr:DMT family transporter [Anaerolineales bacterium]